MSDCRPQRQYAAGSGIGRYGPEWVKAFSIAPRRLAITLPTTVFATALCAALLGSLAGCDRTDVWRSEVEFEVVRERIYDNAPRTQVDQWLVVSGNLTRSNLRALLMARCDSLMARRTYSANERPTNVFIYLFESTAGAEKGGGGWIAMLAKQPGREASIRYGALDSDSKEPSD